MKPTIAAIVPMRHHSQRVPGKNYRPFAGRPLYHHVIGALLHCPQITQIVIDTDSDVIRADAARASLKILLPTVGCVFPTLWLILLGPALLVVLSINH